MALLQRSEDVAAELKRRIELVTKANGYETDLGVKVLLGRSAKAIDRTQVPVTVIVEADDDPERVSVGLQYQIRQPYVLLSFVPCDPDNPNAAAHQALRDLKRAIWLDGGKPDPRWGGRVKDVDYGGRDIAPHDDGEAFVLVTLEVWIAFVENLASP